MELAFGVVLFGNILKWLFENYRIQTKFTFIGLILGSIPLLIKQTSIEKPRFKYLVFYIISFSISLFLIYLENYVHISYEHSSNFLYLLICGSAMSIGVVVPRY